MDPPRVLLLDEPFVGLDLGSRCKLRESLTEATIRRGTTLMMVSHSVDDAVFLSDRVIVFMASPLKIAKVFEIECPRSDRKRSDAGLLEREGNIAGLLLTIGYL
jgi:ABC-type nitrate/sulfonate/bicarbonate transport system ATPase subunit